MSFSVKESELHESNNLQFKGVVWQFIDRLTLQFGNGCAASVYLRYGEGSNDLERQKWMLYPPLPTNYLLVEIDSQKADYR